MSDQKISQKKLPPTTVKNGTTNNSKKIQTSLDLFSPENISKNSVVNIDPESEQNKFYNYVETNSKKKMTPKEEKAALESVKNGIEERNKPKSSVEKYVDGLKQDYKTGQLAERVENNPVTKVVCGILGGALTSCTPIDDDGYYDLVTADYSDPVATGPVNANCIKLYRALGSVIVSDVTPVQTIVGNDPNTNQKFEYKIDKTNSTPDKMIYTGTIIDAKTSVKKEIRNIVVQNDKGISITEEVKEGENADNPKWTAVSKADYALDEKGMVSKYENGKKVCHYWHNVGEKKLYVYNVDGSKEVINDFDATQVSGTLKM